MTRRILLPVLVVLLLQRCIAQERCFTPENKIGACINVRNCPAVIQLLLQTPLTTDTQNYLRSLQCGFEGMIPKVCCAQQTPVTPGTTTTETPRPQTGTTDVPEPPNVSNHPNLQLINDNSCGADTTPKVIGGNEISALEFPWTLRPQICTTSLREPPDIPDIPDDLIGGSRTFPLEYPWMALLAYKTRSDKPEFKCGGSLINKRYVITAAHCVTRLPSGVTLIGVRLGEHNLSTERDCYSIYEEELEERCVEKYQDFGLESVHFHRDFLPRLAQNDIALLRLDRDADVSASNVKPICLPVGFNSTLPSETMTVTGWGRTEHGLASEVLLQADLQIVCLAECAQAYRGKKQIWYKQLCAGGIIDTTGLLLNVCAGDSGGPLHTRMQLQKSVLFGIVSFGQRSCATRVPSVFTNVVYYMDWILNTIRP